MRRPCVAFALAAGIAATLPSRGVAFAQRAPQRAPIAGVVRDSGGTAIAGAEVSVAGTADRAESGDDGAFRIARPGSDSATLRVRRLGFRPTSVVVSSSAAGPGSLLVTLVALSQSLQPIVVIGGRGAGPDRLQGFAERKREGGAGRFFTHEEIERQHLSRMSDLMRLVPGVNVVHTSYPPNAVRLRGQACAPLTWLDGFPLLAGEFDLDALQPESIEAMEVYSGPASIPLRFRGPLSSQQCGAIIIWSRLGRPRAREQGDHSVAAEIAQLVDEQKLFTADQVDAPAHAQSPLPVAPVFPDSLYSARVGGIVVAEFVVETTGDVSREQLTIVSSTHPLFSEAVRAALPRAKFVAAIRAGRAVRQVVQWTFRFDAEAARAR
ncbi:MAG: TonB family protein [Gemmatimonadaceae bacterium]